MESNQKEKESKLLIIKRYQMEKERNSKIKKETNKRGALSQKSVRAKCQIQWIPPERFYTVDQNQSLIPTAAITTVTDFCQRYVTLGYCGAQLVYYIRSVRI